MFHTIGVAENHDVMSAMAYELQLCHKCSKHEDTFGQFLLKWDFRNDYLSLTVA